MTRRVFFGVYVDGDLVLPLGLPPYLTPEQADMLAGVLTKAWESIPNELPDGGYIAWDYAK